MLTEDKFAGSLPGAQLVLDARGEQLAITHAADSSLGWYATTAGQTQLRLYSLDADFRMPQLKLQRSDLGEAVAGTAFSADGKFLYYTSSDPLNGHQLKRVELVEPTIFFAVSSGSFESEPKSSTSYSSTSGTESGRLIGGPSQPKGMVEYQSDLPGYSQLSLAANGLFYVSSQDSELLKEISPSSPEGLKFGERSIALPQGYALSGSMQQASPLVYLPEEAADPTNLLLSRRRGLKQYELKEHPGRVGWAT